MSDHHRKLERMYLSAPCNAQYQGLAMKISEGAAEVGFKSAPEQFHAAGAVHGSYYFKLLDDAAFFAAGSLVEEVFVVTASFTVQLLRPVNDGRLVARGFVTKPGKSMVFAESVLCDAQGQELARGSGVFARSRIALDSIASYR